MSERDWTEIERLRTQVVALENAGMEAAARLGEAEAERDRYLAALERIANAAELQLGFVAMRQIAQEAIDNA